MSQYDHDADTDVETPTDRDLLAEIGLDPRAIREILAPGDGD